MEILKVQWYNLCNVSQEKNPPILSMKYWLVNRDPYNGLLKSPYNRVV